MKKHVIPMIVKLPAWRRRVLLVMLMACFVVLLGRGLYLQGIHKSFLQQKGEARYSRNITLSSHRGKILDRNGEILAMSLPVDSVYANPPDIKASAKFDKKPLEKAKAEKDIAEKLSTLAKLLDIDEKAFKKKIQTPHFARACAKNHALGYSGYSFAARIQALLSGRRGKRSLGGFYRAG